MEHVWTCDFLFTILFLEDLEDSDFSISFGLVIGPCKREVFNNEGFYPPIRTGSTNSLIHRRWRAEGSDQISVTVTLVSSILIFNWQNMAKHIKNICIYNIYI
jgi:hypothetical protein